MQNIYKQSIIFLYYLELYSIFPVILFFMRRLYIESEFFTTLIIFVLSANYGVMFGCLISKYRKLSSDEKYLNKTYKESLNSVVGSIFGLVAFLLLSIFVHFAVSLNVVEMTALIGGSVFSFFKWQSHIDFRVKRIVWAITFLVILLVGLPQIMTSYFKINLSIFELDFYANKYGMGEIPALIMILTLFASLYITHRSKQDDTRQFRDSKFDV